MKISDIIAKHIDACIADLRTYVQAEFAQVLGGGIVAAPVAAERSRPRTKPVARAEKPMALRPQTRAKASASAKPAASGRTCGCGPVGRHRRECKLATGTGPRAAKKPKSDDEDSGAGLPADRDHPDGVADVARVQPAGDPADAADPSRARARTRRRSTATEPAEELPVIPHVVVVKMLAADRANNDVGDLGGLVLLADREPSLVGHADTKREHCPRHGWVGRVAFERDAHEHCRADRPPGAIDCPGCTETPGWTGHGVCARCDGHTYIVEVEALRADNSDKVKATASQDVTVTMTGVDGEEIRQRMRLGRDARGHDRAETTSLKDLTRAELRAGWDEIVALDEEQPGFVEPERPRTRAECEGTQRPCPWVSCRYHLAIDVNEETGSIKLVFPDVDPWELPHSCALDAAALGPHTLEALAEKLNVTRERSRQLEVKALFAAQEVAHALELESAA